MMDENFDVSLYRSKDVLKPIITDIKHQVERLPVSDHPKIRIMNICGTHEDSISRFAVRDLIPDRIELIAGPGCPVCVTPAKDVDQVIEIMRQTEAKILSYGDMIAVPGTKGSLDDFKAAKDDVQLVLGPQEVIKIAKNNPTIEYVFFSPGFETTIPMIALELKKGLPQNVSVYSTHKLVPPALDILGSIPDLQINGFILPGHVSVIIGIQPYKEFVQSSQIPSVIVGFEPLDVLRGILEILKQLNNKSPQVKNMYKRVVRDEGNVAAQKIIYEVFKIVDSNWRGLGTWSNSGLDLRANYSEFNAKDIYADIQIPYNSQDIRKGCSCHEVMIGKKHPTDCKLFNKKCTLDSPYGPCMVGREGACAIQAKYHT